MEEDCPYCKQTLIVIKRVAKDGDYIKSCYGPDGRFIRGIDSEQIVKGQKYYGFPRCPECNEFIGASSEDTEHMSHSHSCTKCGWKSPIYKGDFISI